MNTKENFSVKENEYLEHTKRYTDLLDTFNKNIKSSNNLKNKLKASFFCFIVLLMMALTILFIYSVIKCFEIIKDVNSYRMVSVENIIGPIISIIPSLVTMLTSLVKLPKIIAEYLFNSQEDKDMVSLIEKIQSYDVQMYSLENDIENLLMKKQDKVKKDFMPADILNQINQPQDIEKSKNCN